MKTWERQEIKVLAKAAETLPDVCLIDRDTWSEKS
jgi:hypothetical protein